jgi:hypothetical protein
MEDGNTPERAAADALRLLAVTRSTNANEADLDWKAALAAHASDRP